MNTLRIATINVSTMEGKEEELVEMMIERNLDILGICETRLPGEGSKKLHLDYQLIYKGKENQRMYGVALMLTPEMAERTVKIEYTSDRMLGLVLKLGHVKISLMQTYAPHQGRPVQEKEDFYEELQLLYDRMPDGIKLIMGDLNAHVGERYNGVEQVIGEWSVGDRNVEGDRLIDFATANGLSVMNTFFKHKESHKWSWYRWDNRREEYTEKSMIDLILCNDKRIVNDVKSIPSVSLDSDHRMVIGKLKLKRPEKPRKIVKERFAVERLKDGNVTRSFQNKIINDMPAQNEQHSIEHAWNSFKTTVTNCATETVTVKRVCGGKKKKTIWWTEEVKQAVKEKNSTFRRWIKQRNAQSRQNYVEARNFANGLKNAAKKESWKKIGEELELSMEGSKKLIYGMAAKMRSDKSYKTFSIKDKNGENLLTEPKDIDNRWKEYFSELLNVEEQDQPAEIEEVNQIEVEELNYIHREEVKVAINKMKNGKSPGIDGIPAEIYKGGGECIEEWLTKIFNQAWSQEKIPIDWTKGVVCPIYKKNDRTDCRNYRGITLLSHAGKIYERIIERRLREIVEHKLMDCQHGFRPNRGTTDLIFALKILIEKNWEWDNNLCMVFIDLEKAFDRVPRNRLWEVLEDPYYEVGGKLRKVIKSLYIDCKSAVRSMQGQEEWFDVRAGVRQGGVISPLLFLLYMDSCMRRIGVDEEGEITMAYADDIAIVAKNDATLQRVLNKWNDVLREKGLKINKEKTEILKLSREADDMIIEVEGVRLKKVENFKYLGVTVSDRAEVEIEVKHRIDIFSRNVRMLYPLLKDKNIPKRVKMLIYKAVLRPILLYGSECWTLTTKMKSRVESTEMRVLRLIEGVTRRDRLRNSKVREDLGVTGILTVIERQQLRWYGHVRRMDGQRLPARWFDWQPDGRRPAGRPRKRWKDTIADAIAARGTTMQQVEQDQLFMDRTRWRGFATDRAPALPGVW